MRDRGTRPSLPMRRFGRHPDRVSPLGLGGGHLGHIKSVNEAIGRAPHGCPPIDQVAR